MKFLGIPVVIKPKKPAVKLVAAVCCECGKGCRVPAKYVDVARCPSCIRSAVYG